jgi:hypothetical protein
MSKSINMSSSVLDLYSEVLGSNLAGSLGHDHFLTKPFQFLIHLSSYHSMLYSPADNVD